MEKFGPRKKVMVGTIGHVDHGKSSLCHLLASLDSEMRKDRSPIMEIVLHQSCFDDDYLRAYPLFEKKGRRRAQRKQQRGF